MITKERWQAAQEYEQSYWKNVASQIVSGSQHQLDWYGWKANQMEKHLDGYMGSGWQPGMRILEIGSGPIGIVSFLKSGERYTLDPLEGFYASDETLSKLRNSQVKYGKGGGENIPFPAQYFNLVILDNVLDHVHEASRVLQEIHRVIAVNGLLYFVVNIHTSWGWFLHRILSTLKIDRGHPYTFTLESIRKFLAKHGFTINVEFVSDYEQAKAENLRSASLKSKGKGYTGLSEFAYHAVCSKQ